MEKSMESNQLNNTMTVYLYAKQHNVTGLRYFGKTKRDPHKYLGSGKYWKTHLKKHGNDVTTTWVHAYSDVNLAAEEAAFFSKVYNIVESDEWANLIPEDAKGGGSVKGRKTPWLNGKTRPEHSEKLKGKMSGENNGMFGKDPWNKGLTGTQTGANPKKSLPGEKNGMFGRKQSEETKQKMRDAWAKRKELKEQNNA
jgi:hypothetical protein